MGILKVRGEKFNSQEKGNYEEEYGVEIGRGGICLECSRVALDQERIGECRPLKRAKRKSP